MRLGLLAYCPGSPHADAPHSLAVSRAPCLLLEETTHQRKQAVCLQWPWRGAKRHTSLSQSYPLVTILLGQLASFSPPQSPPKPCSS